MPSLLIRDVDPLLHAKLKARAATHHRSLAEEVRSLLRTSLARQEAAPRPRDLLALVTRLFGPDHGANLDLRPRDRTQDRPPPDFSAP
ncbi:MAG: plasmid stability protein [Proteobacteria bacterium]|nr:plasmid stability protein [Pseudomonadota bacterium]